MYYLFNRRRSYSHSTIFDIFNFKFLNLSKKSKQRKLPRKMSIILNIKVQEKLDILSVGTLPKSIIVILDDDLVDSCKPGDDVTIKYS